MKKILFKIVCREDSSIYIEGSVDMADGSDFCLTFYDSYDDPCFRIPINPYNYYSDEYYLYLDLVYNFQRDEGFMPLLQKFVKWDHSKVTFVKDEYDLILEWGED